MQNGRLHMKNMAKKNLHVIGAMVDTEEETIIETAATQNLLESRKASITAQSPRDGHIVKNGALSPQDGHIVNSGGQISQNGRIVNNGTQKQRRDRTVSNGGQSIPVNHTVNLNRVITGMITEADKQFQRRNQNS